jgi:Arc/MetJ-type ribon-helix-helix transcriptional regulator
MKERLASGDYQSEDDVLRDAFEALKLQDELAEFRQSIVESREQAARGEAKLLDVDALMQRVATRLSTTS